MFSKNFNLSFSNLHNDFGSMHSLGLAPIGSFTRNMSSNASGLLMAPMRRQNQQPKLQKNASFSTLPAKKKKASKGPDKTKTPLPVDFEPGNHTVLCVSYVMLQIALEIVCFGLHLLLSLVTFSLQIVQCCIFTFPFHSFSFTGKKPRLLWIGRKQTLSLSV